ncbi:hypothetical protein [Streptomyces sp. NBC_01353]|uniref:hypothetical protein n=1 Tax=Streptomyces sp. NBC_01353 TaxID=2903835 RepID=UPI002E37BFE1|nr:hypothetical protein [Streptomyces sp. NBC_01353]
MDTRKLSGTLVPSAARLVTAPLPELLAEANAQIFETSVADDTFYGEVVRPHAGAAIVCLPKGRSARERDTMARILVGRLLGTPMAPIPASLEVRTYGGAQ